jgi:nucleoside-diphosphate-sugar epimerase
MMSAIKQKKVVVTGASGFVGSCVVEALFAAGGYEIVPTSRRLHAGGRVARFGCRLRPADLTNREVVDELVRGADAIVHCAFGGDSDQEEATRTLLQAASEASIRNLIHISTAEVYAAQEGMLDEDSPIQSEGQGYGATKGRIDSLVRSSSNHYESLVILRPAIIYGPLSDQWTIGPIRRLLAGWHPSAEELQGTANLVHIADVCRIIEQILSRPPPGFRIYNVIGPEVVRWIDYFERLAQALEVAISSPTEDRLAGEKVELGFVRTLLNVLPTSFRRQITLFVTSFPAGAKMIARWQRLHLLGLLPADKALYGRKVRYSIARLTRDGLVPRVGLVEGIRQSTAWARAIGLAP